MDRIEDRIDLALRVRGLLTSDAAVTMRSLGTSKRILVARPQLESRVASVDTLALLPMLATNADACRSRVSGP